MLGPRLDIGEAMLHETLRTIRCKGRFFNRSESRSPQGHVHSPNDFEMVIPAVRHWHWIRTHSLRMSSRHSTSAWSSSRMNRWRTKRLQVRFIGTRAYVSIHALHAQRVRYANEIEHDCNAAHRVECLSTAAPRKLPTGGRVKGSHKTSSQRKELSRRVLEWSC